MLLTEPGRYNLMFFYFYPCDAMLQNQIEDFFQVFVKLALLHCRLTNVVCTKQ